MSKSINQFDRIGKLVDASDLPEDERRRTADCLRQLPPLWATFSQSYESRDLDKILRLERGMLARLSDPEHPAPGAHDLAKLLGAQLKTIHERLGLPPVVEPVKIKAAKPAPRPRAVQAAK